MQGWGQQQQWTAGGGDWSQGASGAGDWSQASAGGAGAQAQWNQLQQLQQLQQQQQQLQAQQLQQQQLQQQQQQLQQAQQQQQQQQLLQQKQQQILQGWNSAGGGGTAAAQQSAQSWSSGGAGQSAQSWSGGGGQAAQSWSGGGGGQAAQSWGAGGQQAPQYAAGVNKPPVAVSAGGTVRLQGGKGPGGKGGKPGTVVPPIAGPQAYVVQTRGNDAGEVVMKTLMGEYTRKGDNHGRPVYEKVRDKPGADFVEVFLYYWDSRDGPAFEGWWFGNKLGGTQVWSHSASNAMLPPGDSWKIPWDGAVRSTLSVMSKDAQQKQEASGQVQAVTGDVAAAQASAKSALEQARAAAGDWSSSAGLNAAEQLLIPQQPLLQTAMKKIAEMQRYAQGDAGRSLMTARGQLQAVITSVTAEIQKIRQSKAKALAGEKMAAAMEKDQQALDALKPQALEKCNTAEDAVEKANITSEMIQAAGDNADEVGRAVEETEKAAKQAQLAIGAARLFLNQQQTIVQKYTHMKVRQDGLAELQKLNTQITNAQTKLNPLKMVRQDYEMKRQAQHALAEVQELLAPAELEADAAEEAARQLKEVASKDMLQQAQQALKKATEAKMGVHRLVTKKKAGAGRVLQEELAKLEERLKKMDDRLAAVRDAQKEHTERLSSESLIQDATSKLGAVSEAVAKATAAEAPLTEGELPTDQSMAAMKACDSAITLANTAVSIARMFIATKLVEAKRFSAVPAKEATDKLQELQKQLQEHTTKLNSIKTGMATRRQATLTREAETQVKAAEELAGKMKEAAVVFEDTEKLAAMSPEEIAAATASVKQAEQAANPALAEARRFITQRQIEAKGKENSEQLSSMFIKLQTRLSAAQNEVVSARKLSQSVEQKLKATKVIAEAGKKLKDMEDKVAAAVELVTKLEGNAQDASQEAAEEAEPKKEEGEGAAKEEGEAKEDGAKEEGDAAKEEGAKEEGAKDAGAEAKTSAAAPDPAEAAAAAAREAEQVAAAEAAIAEAQNQHKTVARWLEAQGRTKALPPEEVAKFQPRIQQAQEQLDEGTKRLRERQEQAAVKSIVSECEYRVGEAELQVKKVAEAEAPLLAGDELPVEEASNALATLESTVQDAQRAVGGTKTFISMKRLSAKRLSEAAMTATTQELASLQTRVDTATKKLGEVKRGLAERKLAVVRREAQAKLADVEKQVEAAKSATQALLETADSAPDTMKAACEKAGTTQQQAFQAVEALQRRLASRQQDSALPEELSGVAEKCNSLQAEMETQRGLLRDQEHKFVAGRLMKEATDMLDGLTDKMEKTEQGAACLVQEDFSASLWLDNIIQVLKAKMQREQKDVPTVFQALGGEGGKLTEAKFVSFLSTLPELLEDGHQIFSEEELKAAFGRLRVGEEGEVTAQQFADQFLVRYVCVAGVSMTNQLAVKGGKVVSKLSVNDVLEAVEEPTRDEATKILRVKAKADKDGKEGYVTLSGNQGTVYLETYSPFAASERRVAKTLQEMQEAITKCGHYMDAKSKELQAVRQGPLSECRSNLQQLRPKVGQIGTALAELSRKVSEAKRKHADALEDEKTRRQEAKERRAAKSLVEEASASEKSLQELVEKAVPAAEELIQSLAPDADSAAPDTPLEAMTSAEKQLQAAVNTIEEAAGKLKGKLDEVRSATRGALGEARSSLTKMKASLDAMRGKCKAVIGALQAARRAAADDAYKAVMGALCEHARKEALTADALFERLSKGAPTVASSDLRDFIAKIPEQEHPLLKLKASSLDMGLERYSAGMSKMTLLEMLQEFMRCVKEIALTSSFELKDGKAVRKLQPREIVEVLERKRGEDAAGLERVRCRALLDDQEGWVTVLGNQGTSYLDSCPKPYYSCEEEIQVHAALESSSAVSRRMRAGEVLEVLEGPKQESALELVRVNCRAAKDGKTGWVTLKVGDGEECMEKIKVYVCMQPIAITNDFNISTGKAIRKLEAGEIVDVLEEPKEDEKKKMSRVKIKTRRDAKEGWVTLKGNQGTSFVEESHRHHALRSAVPLGRQKASGSMTLRVLEEGELVEVLGEPQAEKEEGARRLRGRSLSDNTEGWFTMSDQRLTPWRSALLCAVASPLTEDAAVSSSERRALRRSEALQAFDVPCLDSESGLVRVRVRADADGACGFATVRDANGEALLKCRPES